MFIQKMALSTILLAVASTAMAAPGYDRDDNVSNRYSNKLRLKSFDGKSSYQVKVNPLLSADRDEPVSTRRATVLRLKAFV